MNEQKLNQRKPYFIHFFSFRCSYEEMVHEDTEEVPVPTGNGYGDQSHASDDIWYQAVLRMTQWAITLQEVHDERSRGKYFVL